MSDSPAPADRDESAAAGPSSDIEVLPPETPPPAALPAGVVPSRNYSKAIELGHVAAESGLYPDARTAARAAMVIMIGMDLGLGPAASMQGIHILEKSNKVTFIIEGKVLAAVVQRHPNIGYEILERDDEHVVIQFTRDGQTIGPDIEWTMDRAKRAGLTKNDTYTKYPREMLTWRALAEGIRLYCPEVLAGQPVYVDAEFGPEDGNYREALEPAKAQPLTDDEAEKQRAKLREVFDELKAINPDRLLPPLFAGIVQRAEHSHERLKAEIERLEDLRDTERTLANLKAQATETLDAPDAKALIDRAERRASNRERIATMEAGLGTEKAEADGEGEGDGGEG